MAHQIAKTKGQDAFVSVKEIPWHGLGKIVQKKMTAAECIVLAGLDYTVDKTPVLAKIKGKVKQVEGKYVTYRTDSQEVFDVVGSRYHIVQNKEAFTFFDEIVGHKQAIYETAGALGVGERIFITAKLPSHIKVGKDVIDQYLYLTSTHDGSGSIKAAFTPVRIVCNNTLQMALGDSKRMVSIRHTMNAVDAIKQAHKLMGIVAAQADTMKQALQRMTTVKITDAKLRHFIELAMHPEREQITKGVYEEEYSSKFINTVDDIIAYALSNPTQQTAETKGTLYGAYNAISGYFQNVKEYGSPEEKLDTLTVGTGARKGQHAMAMAIGVLTNKIKLQ